MSTHTEYVVRRGIPQEDDRVVTTRGEVTTAGTVNAAIQAHRFIVVSEREVEDHEPEAIGRTESDGEAAVSRVFELVPGDQITAGDIVIFDRKPRRIIARSAVFLPADDLLPAMQMIGLYYRTEWLSRQTVVRRLTGPRLNEVRAIDGGEVA